MSRPILFFIILSFATIFLSACETASQKKMPNGYVVRQTQDFMETGHGLSDGAVDLYQPGTDFLPTAQYPVAPRLSAASGVGVNSNIVSSDPSVTIYSLDTMEVQEPAAPPLPPGVPALQPPVSLQSDYPSPFDEREPYSVTPLKIAIAGLGTVVAGVVRLLRDNRDTIRAVTGRDIVVTAVSARDPSKDRGVDLSGMEWVSDPADLLNVNPDVMVELIGGDGDPAYSLVKKALQKNIAVVTANKSLLAHHGAELAQLSDAHNAPLLFEAAIAGGIPIVKTLREGLAANNIHRLYGILNGTCNYILTTMEQTGRGFADVLSDAQKLGYAEADPTLDIGGGDTAHKLCLLAALIFKTAPDLKSVSSVTGISSITADDISFAAELGYRIKLLGQAEEMHDGRVVQLVEPCLIPVSSSLANVHGVLNAVYTLGDHVGSTFMEGRGAGAGPTASSVVADLIDLARGHRLPVFGVSHALLAGPVVMPAAEETGEYYLRLVVLDQPGVIADIAAILRDYGISIESLIQRGRDPGQPVNIVLTTHEAVRGNLNSAIEKIAKLNSVTAPPLVLERLDI